MTGTTDALVEAAFAAGRADLAAELLRGEALPIPAAADAKNLHASAVGHFQAGRFAEAERDLRLALRLSPGTAQLHEHFGVVLASQQRFQEAEATFRIAVRLAPEDPSPRRNWARCLIDLQRFPEAETVLSGLAKSGHATAETWDRLGTVRGILGDYSGAAECFLSQLALDGTAAGAWSNLAAALGKQRDWSGAIEAGRQAVRLAPHQAAAWSNYGNALRDFGRVDEAIEALRTAVRLDPNLPDATGNLALALATRGDLDAALPWYDRAVALNPRGAEARLNRAVAWLASGDFARGLPEYEWRFGTEQMRGYAPLPGTPWRRESLAGKSIAVQCEQGLGDAMQFSRLATRLYAQGATVTLIAPPTLKRLLQSVAGVDRVVGQGDPLPATDFVTALMSLPLLTGLDVGSIPNSVPSLTAPPEAVEAWRAKLSGVSGLKIGVAWQGNPNHVGDRFRSVPLRQFAPLAAVPGVSLISLQLGSGREQLARTDFPIQDLFDPEPRDFAETAGLIEHLDLVISVDSAVAHLAGCLARPVWVLLPVNADWRWLRDRPDSPWYPTARLFRQTTFGDWNAVIPCLATELHARVENGSEVIRPAPSGHQQ